MKTLKDYNWSASWDTASKKIVVEAWDMAFDRPNTQNLKGRCVEMLETTRDNAWFTSASDIASKWAVSFRSESVSLSQSELIALDQLITLKAIIHVPTSAKPVAECSSPLRGNQVTFQDSGQ